MGAIHVERWLRALGQRLDPTEVARLHAFLDEQLVPALPAQVRPRPILRRRPKPRLVSGQAELFDARPLDLAEMERAAAAGIEAWMSYLHPSQMEAVKRRFTGPSRLRGPAGCGKTVVALHRAAFLAGTCEGEGLFTSYVRTLPSVLGTLYARLSPGTADRFTFRGVHSLAHGMLRDANVHFKVDPHRAASCFNDAWEAIGRERLETEVLRRDYWHEEVFSVIKGRGLVDFEQYADLARIGRRTPLNANQRRAVWDLYVEYQRLLERAGILDFDDVIDRACSLAEEGHAKQFRFVFVDETQDLTLQALRLLSALVSDERDGLTLVGDGQQAIYPGGFTLKEAGISVSGRSTILDVNYRNSQAVLDFAESFVREFEFDDLEDVAEPGNRAVRTVRPGGRVLRVEAANRASAELALLQRLVEDQANGFPLASAAVLCHGRRDVERLRRLLGTRGIATVGLEDYDGTPIDALKVGTAKRAKGLEFARVYVPHAEDYFVDMTSGERERVEREHRELFVALTRARDGLWICRAP